MAEYSRNNTSAPPAAAAPAQSAAALSKAQQFEDEKRRIVQSCFSKQDPDGSLLESYITHCRVTEDGSSPEPPPPGASNDQRKARVIMVAVRKSGRVRMHKARENPNGSFSIGKTWNLDDLQAITNYGPPNERGFTVTILKSYYWQANSAKEKDFFIASLLKIYKKYTAGKVPELIGFSRTELDAMLGPGGAQIVAKQRQEEEVVRQAPRTPTSIGGGSLSSLPPPLTRNLSTAPSSESLSNIQTRGANAYQRGPDGRLMGSPLPSPTIRSARSTDAISNRRTPSEGPLNRHMTPPPPTGVVPPVPQGAQPLNGRRTSDGSSTRSGQSRAPSSSRAPRAEDPRRAPSQERFRTPSINSQVSQESRREPTEQLAGTGNSLAPSPTTTSFHDNHTIPKKKSSKDVASQFRLAANTYGAGSQLVPKGRPKTPTTPIYPSSPMYAGSTTASPEAPTPAMPQIKYPDGRSRTAELANGGGSGYRRPSGDGRRPSGDGRRPSGDGRRPSEDGRRPSEDGRRPSGEDRRPRSPARTLSDQSSLSPIEPPPLVHREPPPRNEARGRSTPLPREDSQNATPSSLSPRPPPTINEPVLMVQKPQVAVPTPVVSRPESEASDTGMSGGLHAPLSEPRSRSKSPGARGRKRRSGKTSVYLEGLDKSGLSVDIDELLLEFNWDGQRKIDQLRADVKKELSRVESSNVVVNVEGDDRVEQLSILLDKAIKECEDMDGLLTLYAVELTSLNDDIAHIENQSQGLQLQTANQKTLQKELQTLLDTISISPAQMDVLKQGSLESPRGLEQIEQTLSSLYKAMKTIDPGSTIDPSTPKIGRRGSFSDEGVGSMRALQERKEEYRSSCHAFLVRLRQFLNARFQSEFMEIKKEATGSQVNTGFHPRLIGHDKAYQRLWKFSGLIAFARDVDGDEYVELRKLYEKPVKQVIQDEVRDHIIAWKRITKQEEPELVFNVPEKEELVSSSLSAARKLTVKKSIARIRTGGGSFGGDRASSGIISSHEAFSGAFGEIYQMVFKEQNFVVDFFHLSSRSSGDFADLASSGTPETRKVPDLGGIRAVEPDKLKAKLVFEFLSIVFSFLPLELQNMVDWATQTDAIQGVGIMYAVEQKMTMLDETDQEFLFKTLQKLHDRLSGLFARFLDEQIKAIEETKVKIKKRKGVIGFMRVFPGFSAKIEEQIPYSRTSSDDSDDLDVREMVNEGYAKINKAMFESLQAIAKDSPNAASQSVDPEDKEQLNYHIMMIENMHHYLEEVDTKNNGILEGFKKTAQEEFKEHLGLYIGAVIRRPLAKLLDFVENVEALQKAGTEDVASRSSHNKAAFKKVLDHHGESKDIRKGIEQLKKRVDKHFGDGDDAALSHKLVEAILGKLEDEYINLHKRIMLLLVGPYKDMGLECQFMVSDIRNSFKGKA